VPRTARALLAVLCVEILLFGVSTLPGIRAEPGFDPLWDGVLQASGYLTAAALAVLRPVTRSADREIWSWVAAALVLRALGFVLFLGVVRWQVPEPAPSVADACWLAMYPLMGVALVRLARLRSRRFSVTLALDGAVGALAAAAVAVVLLEPTLVSIAARSAPAPALAVAMAYPVLDVMLLALIVGAMPAYGWRPGPAVWSLAAGILGIAVIDLVFVYASAAGTFRPGTPLSSMSLVVMALAAVAAWLPDSVSVGRRDPIPDVVLPAVFAVVCLGLLLYATRQTVPVAGVALAGAGVAAALARTALSFHAVRLLAEHRREARTDELTGLANRRSFNETLHRTLAARSHGQRLALLVVDLDDFKAVNDSLGHHYGDELLRSTAPRLQQAIRGGDVVARIGGDEFAVLLTDADADLAVRIAERLRAGFQRPFRLGSRDIRISPSIGIALVPDDGQEPVELLQHADLAMYEAKATRSGQAVFHRQLHPSGRMRLETTERLREAIERDEMVLHYQTQIDLRSGEVAGVEALVRWQHPQDGLLPPQAFLHQVESGGLMPQLTRALLRPAVAQAVRWHREGRRLTVAVNLSVTNLLDPAFPDEVSDVLARAGLPPGTLELELTEDLFMADPARARIAVATLLDAGVSLMIDDYGTGYSSLGYLRDLRDVRGLKLDRSFVTHMDADPRAAAIVESTIGLAHSLGMHVVAEGVESAAVLDLLTAMGCEFAQGYFISAPAPADELERHLPPVGVRRR
jgi:diguanylate cyclase (GGDEF)-like protein